MLNECWQKLLLLFVIIRMNYHLEFLICVSFAMIPSIFTLYYSEKDLLIFLSPESSYTTFKTQLKIFFLYGYSTFYMVIYHNVLCKYTTPPVDCECLLVKVGGLFFQIRSRKVVSNQYNVNIFFFLVHY